MTRAQIKSYLTTEAIAAQIETANISARVDEAINMGLRSFWGAWNWYFKMKEVTFTVTTTATNYDAPKDFGGLIKIVDQGSARGGDLTYFAKEEFDRRFPKPSADSAGVPVVVTTYLDAGKWKLQFYPRPTVSRDFNLVYEIDSAFAVEAVPDNFADGLMVFCAKYIPRMASDQGMILEQRAEIVLRRLMIQNTAHKKPMNALSSQGPTEVRLPVWADPNAGIS